MRANKLWNEKMSGKDLSGLTNTFTFSLEQLEQLFSIRIKSIHGCFSLIFGDEEDELGWEKSFASSVDFKASIKKSFGNEVGYEFSGTELRIIDWLDQELTVAEQYQLGMVYIRCMNNRLTLMTDKKIHYVLGFSDDTLTIWFYQDWEDSMGHFEELEGFDGPVAVLSSDEVSTSFFKM